MRMSASSSTIRISCAMGNRIQVRLGGRRGDNRSVSLGCKHQSDARSACFRVLEKKLALVIFHDLFDDGEPQTGALGSCCDIRLRKPLATALWQSLAVVLD